MIEGSRGHFTVVWVPAFVVGILALLALRLYLDYQLAPASMIAVLIGSLVAVLAWVATRGNAALESSQLDGKEQVERTPTVKPNEKAIRNLQTTIGGVLYLAAVAYLAIGVLFSAYASFVSDCSNPAGFLEETHCGFGVGISHAVIVLGWPLSFG